MTKLHHPLASPRSTRAIVAACVAAFGIVSLTENASAQGVVRRLGTRIRETVQQRGPLLQPPAVSPSPTLPAAAAPVPAARPPATPSPATRLPAQPPRTSNYNAPQTRAEVGRSAASAPRSANSAPTVATPTPGSRPAPALNAVAKPPINPARVPASVPTLAARARLGLIVETPPVTQLPGGRSRPTRGALVVGTEPGSGSEAAGMLPGDLVVAIDGRTVMGVDDLVAKLGTMNPGDPVELKFVRNQKLAAVTSLMAGPDGKLSAADHAAIKSLAASDSSNNSDDPADEPTDSPSAISGLGRALGGWFAGGKAPAADRQSKPTQSADVDAYAPLTKQAIEPLEGGVVQIDYESLRPKSNDDSLSASPGTMTIDPPSLDQPMGDEPAELLPPPAVADVTDGSVELAPALSEAEDDATSRQKTSVEQSTIESLLKELGLLRLRIEQLEAEKANPPKS